MQQQSDSPTSRKEWHDFFGVAAAQQGPRLNVGAARFGPVKAPIGKSFVL